jgi:protein-S-isoprenylcysteine O-methyltransferase Ste14
MATMGSPPRQSARGRVPPESTRDHAGAPALRVPPPLYYAAAFAAGLLLRGVSVPLPIGAGSATVAIGAVVLAAGAALALAGVVEVVRHHTTIVPHHAVATLVTSGAYRLSRNPMYTGLALAYLGGTALANSWWPLVTLPLALLAVWALVVVPEERYLTVHFGQAYADYRSRTRRWL